MGWLIVGLVLALLGGLAVFTRWGSRRPVGDDTLVAELLGPSAVRGLPARPVRQEVGPPPAPAAQPAGEGDWLETQLASITAWSARMHEQIASAAADPELAATGQPRTSPAKDVPQVKREPQAAAFLADASRLIGHGPSGPSKSGPASRRCIATTARGSQCKLPAEPGDTTCAIHARRAHP
jgi:hypothetical protein